MISFRTFESFKKRMQRRTPPGQDLIISKSDAVDLLKHKICDKASRDKTIMILNFFPDSQQSADHRSLLLVEILQGFGLSFGDASRLPSSIVWWFKLSPGGRNLHINSHVRHLTTRFFLDKKRSLCRRMIEVWCPRSNFWTLLIMLRYLFSDTPRTPDWGLEAKGYTNGKTTLREPADLDHRECTVEGD